MPPPITHEPSGALLGSPVTIASIDTVINGEIDIENIEEYELPTANEITEFELDSESEIEDNEDNFEVTDSCSSSKNKSCD